MSSGPAKACHPGSCVSSAQLHVSYGGLTQAEQVKGVFAWSLDCVWITPGQSYLTRALQ